MTGEIQHSPIDSRATLDRALVDIQRYYIDQDPENATMGLFAQAFREAMDEPYFSELVGDMYETRGSLDPRYAYNLLLRGYQADLLVHDPAYPRGYTTSDSLTAAFEEIDDDPLRREILWINVCTNNVQSSVAQRYKTVKMLAALTGDRFDNPPSHLDVGSSVGHGNVKLVYNQSVGTPRVPFAPIEVLEHVPGPAENSSEAPIDHRLTHMANTALKQHVEFGAVMGIDITNIDDPVTKQWAKSCSFYPDELKRKQLVQEYDDLDHLDPDHKRAQFFRGDFSRFDRQKFKKVSPVKEYDFITFSTVLYQVPPRDQTAMIVNAINMLSPNGIIVIQDAPDGNFSKKYNYVASVIDGADIEAGQQELLRWENGRCKKAVLGMGQFAVRGTKQTFANALAGLAT